MQALSATNVIAPGHALEGTRGEFGMLRNCPANCEFPFDDKSVENRWNQAIYLHSEIVCCFRSSYQMLVFLGRESTRS
jgi:hypothetical protein